MTQTQKNMPEPWSLEWARRLLQPNASFDASRPFRDHQLEDTASRIAAASELLTMLKWLYEYGCQHDFDLHYPDFPLLQIDKLIAKAGGR